MDRIIDFAMDRKRVVILILLLILFSGFYTYSVIPRENTPDVQIPIIYVSMHHEGISPDDAEDMLIRPMENELKNIDGIKKMTSTARENHASVLLEFSAGFDSNKALQDVREKVETAKAELPDETDEPTVNEVNLSTFPVLNVIMSGPIPERALQNLAENLKEKVESIETVLSVEIAGEKEKAVDVLISPALLESYGLTANIVDITKSNNLLIAAGAIDTNDGRYVVKVPGLLDNVEDLLTLPLVSDGDNVIEVKDVADLRKTFKDPTGYARANGQSALVLEVSKRTGENIIETINQVKKVVEDEKKFWPQNVNILFAQDQSDKIENMVNELQNNIILAIILVIVVIIAFIGIRSAGLIAFSIPGAFLIGILTLGMLGLTLNIVVLFSLIMSIGMLVDSSIIIIEYANRKMAEGQRFSEAFANAAKRMAWPVIASTITTLVVFAPLLFWPGTIGQFMKYMPLTLIATLSGSLLMALIFMPVVSSLIGRGDKASKEEKDNIKLLEEGDLSNLKGFTKSYVTLLKTVIHNSGKALIAIFSLLVVVVLAYSKIGKGVEFFPAIEPENLQVVIRSRGNFSTNQKDQITKEVEAKISDLDDEIDVFYTRSGIIAGQGKDFPEDTIGLITLELSDWQNRRRASQIIADIRSRTADIPGVLVEVLEQRDGPPSGKKINIEVSSRFPEMINPTVDKIISKMKETGKFIDIADTRPAPEIEWKINVDKAQAAKFGVNMALLGNFVKLVTNGLLMTTYRPDESDDEVDILLRFPEKYRDISMLDNLKVITDKGGVPISNFVEREAKPKVGKIERIDGLRTIKISADPAQGYLADSLVKEMQKYVREAYQSGQLDDRILISFEGENEDQAEAASFLRNAFILAIFGMILILTLQFNSLYQTAIIMSAIILSTIGVLLGLMITAQPFGVVMCGVGIIALAGIVVNNNIIFIDTYKVLRERGLNIEEAIIRTGAQRLRPILLTAVTTVLGLLPMVFQMNIDFLNRVTTFGAPSTQWWQQLSTTIAGGLTFSTILTLFFTPALLYMGDKIFFRKKKDD
jgi:multidrug efflux pump